MDEDYDTVPPAAKPEEVVVNDGLPDTSYVEPGSEDDTPPPPPDPEPPAVEQITCDDGSKVDDIKDCPVNVGTSSGEEFADPCDGEYKLQKDFITNCLPGGIDGDIPEDTDPPAIDPLNCILPEVEIGGACAVPELEPCGPGLKREGDICIRETLVSCDPGWIRSADQVNCEMGSEMILEIDAQAEADRIAAEIAASKPPPSAVPSLAAFDACMAQSMTIVNPDDTEAEAEGRAPYLLYPEGNFQDCRFPDGNFQSDWKNTGKTYTEEDVQNSWDPVKGIFTVTLGAPIFEEMWNLTSHGLQTADWYKERGINAPTWDVMKSLSGGTDGTYHWDGKGNITGGPCCEGDTCGGEGYKSGSFRICDSDPNKEARGWVEEGGDPNHYQNTLRSISHSLNAQAFIGGTSSAGLILGYRPPRDMWAKDELLFAYNNLLGQQTAANTALANAQTAAATARQAAIDAAAIAKTAADIAEAERLQRIADEKEEELRKANEPNVYTGDSTTGVIGTSYDITTKSPALVEDVTPSGMRTSTAIATGSVPSYSLSEGIDSLNTEQAPPIEIKEGDMSWLVGGATNVGGATTSSGSSSVFQQFLDAGGQKGELPSASSAQSVEPDPWDMFSGTTQTNNAPLFGPQSQPSTNPLMIPIEQRQKDVMNIFGSSQPSLTQAAKDLFSGF